MHSPEFTGLKLYFLNIIYLLFHFLPDPDPQHWNVVYFFLLRLPGAVQHAILSVGEGSEGAHHLAHHLAVSLLNQSREPLLQGEIILFC